MYVATYECWQMNSYLLLQMFIGGKWQVGGVKILIYKLVQFTKLPQDFNLIFAHTMHR